MLTTKLCRKNRVQRWMYRTLLGGADFGVWVFDQGSHPVIQLYQRRLGCQRKKENWPPWTSDELSRWNVS
jgi:hypothetical protein